jgi:hypothetical protein
VPAHLAHLLSLDKYAKASQVTIDRRLGRHPGWADANHPERPPSTSRRGHSPSPPRAQLDHRGSRRRGTTSPHLHQRAGTRSQDRQPCGCGGRGRRARSAAVRAPTSSRGPRVSFKTPRSRSRRPWRGCLVSHQRCGVAKRYRGAHFPQGVPSNGRSNIPGVAHIYRSGGSERRPCRGSAAHLTQKEASIPRQLIRLPNAFQTSSTAGDLDSCSMEQERSR